MPTLVDMRGINKYIRNIRKGECMKVEISNQPAIDVLVVIGKRYPRRHRTPEETRSKTDKSNK